MHASGDLLTLRGITKRFAYRSGPLRRVTGSIAAVTDVNLAIPAGHILGLVGESGCGKTTLAKLMTCLEPPTEGHITYRGQRLPEAIHQAPAIRREIQMVFQDPTSSLNPRQRVGAVLQEVLLVHRLASGADERHRRMESLLEHVGLPVSYARRYPRELSGGERQRVAIARALAIEPRLLILDEPVASLDVYVGAQILQLLKRLQQQRGLTYVMISHDLRVIGSLCQTIAVMYLGRVVEVAPTVELFRDPWHPYTELLLESAGLRQRGIQDQGELPSPLAPPSGCAFRTRCPLAQDVCAGTRPLLEAKKPRRWVACHFRPER